MEKKETLFRENLFLVSGTIFFINFVIYLVIKALIANYDCFSVSNPIILKYSIVLGIFLFLGSLFLIKKYYNNFSLKECFTVNGLFGFFLIIVGFSLFSNILIRLVNTFDFYSEVKTIKEIVIGSKQVGHNSRDKRHGNKSWSSYHLTIENSNKLFEDNLVEVESGVFTKAYFGDELIFKVKPGFLRFPRKSGKFEIKYNYEYEKAVEKRDKELLEKYRQEQANRKNR